MRNILSVLVKLHGQCCPSLCTECIILLISQEWCYSVLICMRYVDSSVGIVIKLWAGHWEGQG